MSRLLALFAILLSMVVLSTALSVEVKIKPANSNKLTCKGFITFVALDSDCGDCLYGVHDLRYAAVQCRTPEAAATCCKTVVKKW